MNRREFMCASGAALTAGGLGLGRASAGTALLPQVGLQLFSIPHLLEKDFRRGIELVESLRYSYVELYGPYPFSAPEAIAEWNSITPKLGFTGSGFFGLTAEQVHSTLEKHRLAMPSMHTDLLTLQTRMGPLADAAHVLGATYVVLPAIPESKRKTLDDYKRMADAFNVIGEQARRHGLRYAYHNHGYGWHEMEGEIPTKVLLQGTDPSLVFLEMDIYWTIAGGADPISLLKTYPSRYKMMHLKDMKEVKHFKGDGGDPQQWIALFPYMTSVGDGALDIKGIVAQARQSGVAYFFVEQDMVANPEVTLRRSAQYLLG